MLTVMNVLGKQGKLSPAQSRFMDSKRAPEELYDLKADPFELTNLADDPAFTQKLQELRKVLDNWMLSGDKGQYPEDPAEVSYARELMDTEYKKKMIEMGPSPDISDQDFLAYWEQKLGISNKSANKKSR